MGDFTFSAHTTTHPDRLWIWRQGVYVDENDRTWVPVNVEMERRLILKVLMRQEDVPRGEATRPSQLPPSLLPLMWQLYPGRRYRASDSSFWRIVYHIEVGGTEDLLLEQMPDP
ncbi:T-cell leukemia/lymphoma protein 1A-like [Pteronotus mesoamericanus]|uniref:T-cell leukemia/lymphoma protein 1A-like n=1 Tax=Pteronotus mesoamericanus TaxID=1884717 RepID=UPI0023EA7CC0|nr:T-cell leukemia/lymphoma protein 1A-like [Pteronotus parnellii mesoamericanus]